MTERGRYLVLNRGLQAWIDRGRPLWSGDNELQEDRAFRVAQRDGQVRLSYRMSEAARLVSVSQTFLGRQVHLGYLHAKKAGGVYLIPRPALLEWVEQLHDVEYRPRGGWLPAYRPVYQPARPNPFRRSWWDR